MSLFYKLLRIGLKHTHALTLNIRTSRSADIRTLVPDKAGLFQRMINNIDRTLDIALAVGVLNPQNKGAVVFLRKQIRIQRRAQIPDVHIAGRTGRKSCSNLPIK